MLADSRTSTISLSRLSIRWAACLSLHPFSSSHPFPAKPRPTSPRAAIPHGLNTERNTTSASPAPSDFPQNQNIPLLACRGQRLTGVPGREGGTPKGEFQGGWPGEKKKRHCTQDTFKVFKQDRRFAAMWMELEILILSEVSQKKKDSYRMISLICRI